MDKFDELDLQDYVKLKDISTSAFFQGTDPKLLEGSEITTSAKPESQYLLLCIRSSPLLQKRNEILEILPTNMEDDNLVSWIFRTFKKKLV